MNPRHASTPTATILLAPAAVFTIVAFTWALHHRLAAAVVAGGTVFIVAIVGGVTAATAWIEGRKELADREDHIAELEKALVDEQTVRRHTEAAFAEFQQSVSDAGGRVVLPVRPVKPELYVVEPEGGDVPMADEPTPIHDRALIDAWIEDVQTWGEDVER